MDLTSWYLTDDATRLTQWQFPATLLPANGYLVVFASGRNTNVAGQLHTNFKLSSSLGYLGLDDPAMHVISAFSPTYPQQYTDVSYGRDRLDPTLTGYFVNATPGAPNSTTGAGFGGEVLFSRAGGTFLTSFSLALSTPDTNSDIRYVVVTTNVLSGSSAVTIIPTTNSPVYTAPITLSNAAQVHARTFPRLAGYFPGPPHTECYVPLTPAATTFTSDLPVLILHNLAGGAVPQSTDQSVIAMLFEPVDGHTSLTNPPTLVARAGMNIRGRSTACYPKSSFALEIWDEFNQARNVGFCGMADESDWVLYAPNAHDTPLLHDSLMHQLDQDLGRYSSRTRFAEVFLNTSGGAATFTAPAGGNYNGIYVIEEKIKRGKNRVDVDKLEPTMTNAPAITGGYLVKFDSADPGEPTFLAGGIPPGPDGGSTQLYQYPDGTEMISVLRAAQNSYLTNYFNAFYTALTNANWTNPAAGYAQFFDVAAGIDHHLLNVLALNPDAFRLSGYLHKPRNGGITMGPLWDLDISLGTSTGDTRPFNPRSWRGIAYDGGTDYFNASQYYNNAWYHRMFTDPDFWQRYIDRYQELRADLWSTNYIFALVDSMADQVRSAQPREVARWQGSGPSDTSPRNGVVSANGYTYDFGALGTYQGEIDFLKHWLADRLDFMDTNFLARPLLSRAGGAVSNGFTLSITGPAEVGSTVYFTLDGTDPRAPGGAIAAGAQVYAAPLTLSNNARVVTRAWNPSHHNLTGPNNPPISSSWSGVNVATYVVTVPSLAITELMYHPAPPPAGTNDTEGFEFIELKNVGAQPLNLVGIRFTNGISFTFTATNAVTNLGPGQYLVLAANAAAFLSRYPTVTNLAGQYSGHLDNAGEHIYLEGPLQETILDFSYDDGWYPTTDGQGFSLVIRNECAPFNTWTIPASWRLSTALGGSPGRADPAAANLPPVVLNEALTHSPPPQTDRIELYNPTGGPALIGGWFLTDDHQNPAKFRIPDNTVIPAGGFVVFDETQFNAGGSNSFALSSLGQEVYLFSGDGTSLTGYRHGFEFGAQLSGVTFGRYVSSDGLEHFVAQEHATLGVANAGPKVGPVVINEIMYAPPPLGLDADNLDEYVELRNCSSQAVPLFDPAHGTNTWRLDGGIQFTFPLGVTMAPSSYLLVVHFDPDHDPVMLNWFRNRYGVAGTTPIYGPYQGELANEGERVALYLPDQPEASPSSIAGFVPYVLVEEVNYSNQPPWPVGADGTGNSLQRIASIALADDPANWQAAAPTAGSLNQGAWTADTDRDGLPDEWELANGLDPKDPTGVNGPLGDPDGDGMNNLAEYLAGTSPTNALSCLRLQIQPADNQLSLSFEAAANHSYTIQFADALGSGAWQQLTNIATRATNHIESVADSPSVTNRYYRLITPHQP